MELRTLLAILLVPALLLACADRDTPSTLPERDNTSGQAGEQPTSLSITYSGGIAAGRGSSVFSVQDDRAAYTSMGADNSVLRVQERRLTPQEQEEFQELVADIDTLEPEYGEELRGDIADASTAEIVLVRAGEQTRTVINPDVEAAYPDALSGLMDWVNNQMRLMQDDESSISCSDPRPESCAQVDDPVCGDDGKTYSNGCVACSTAAVNSYTAGEC